MSGLVSHLKGQSGEASVERIYLGRAAHILARRWRGRGGEIDLILEEAGRIVFVEVKTSRTIDGALSALGPRQQTRLIASASDFLQSQPKGSLSNMRFDVAAVDGQGRVEIVENAVLA
ncbi:MAG: YraN family protein [Pseudomonadota bacterium]